MHISRGQAGLDPLGAVLLLIGALLLVLLPMQHGVFYADRVARQLERAPEGVTGLTPPIWLVDRGASDRVVLYGHAADGQARLVTLKAENARRDRRDRRQQPGHGRRGAEPVTSTSVLLAWATSTLSSLLLAGAVAAQPPPRRPREAAWDASLPPGSTRSASSSRASAALREGQSAGSVWRVDVRTGERQRIGNAADLAWPVPSPDGTAVYALRGRQVVRIAVADGRETPVGAPADWRKLLGVLPDGTVLGFRRRRSAPAPGPARAGRQDARNCPRRRTMRSASGTALCCRRGATMPTAPGWRCGIRSAAGGGATSSWSAAPEHGT